MVILVEFYFGFKVIGVKTFIFNPKNIEGDGRGHREGLKHTLWHADKTVEG